MALGILAGCQGETVSTATTDAASPDAANADSASADAASPDAATPDGVTTSDGTIGDADANLVTSAECGVYRADSTKMIKLATHCVDETESPTGIGSRSPPIPSALGRLRPTAPGTPSQWPSSPTASTTIFRVPA